MDASKVEFKNIPTSDDPEDGLSSTDVEDSLMGDEKPWHLAKPKTRRSSQREGVIAAARPYLQLVNTALLVVIIVLLFTFRSQSSPPSTIQVGGDFAGSGPTCKSTHLCQDTLTDLTY
jgi:hypothetical protein